MVTKKFEHLFGGPARVPGSPITQRHKDIAAALQKSAERVLLSVAAEAAKVSGEKTLCLAGGVAQNGVANGKIAASQVFDSVYVPPAPGDAGGCVGAALYIWHDMLGHPKISSAMEHAYLGPAYGANEIRACITRDAEDLAQGRKFTRRELSDTELFATVAALLEGETAVGWFQGRMEFGPRALGNRSILADPRHKQNWQRINQKIKFRESFRPLAPSVLAERSREYFDLSEESPYMSFVAPVISPNIPAVTHVDRSARIQTVREETNPRFYKLIEAFYARTGCAVVMNTSLNVHDEPIAMTPYDALRCFFATDMDYLVLGNTLVSKNDTIDRS